MHTMCHWRTSPNITCSNSLSLRHEPRARRIQLYCPMLAGGSSFEVFFCSTNRSQYTEADLTWSAWIFRYVRIYDPVYMSRKIRKFRTDKFDSETNGNFDSCNSCKRLGTSRLHELHEFIFELSFELSLSFAWVRIYPFETSNFSAHVHGVYTSNYSSSNRNFPE